MRTPGVLFEVGPGDVALTSDDWYTPRWIFDAAGLDFDMDVCAPVNPSYRSCPAREYLTVVEDGEVTGAVVCVRQVKPAGSNGGRVIKRLAAVGAQVTGLVLG